MKPVLQALLVADHVYQDKTTGKNIVAGIFNKLFFQKPEDVKEGFEKQGIKVAGHMQAGSPYAYINLIDVNGEHHFTLRYVDLEDDKPLFQVEFGIRHDNPLQPVELNIPLPRLPTPKTGAFALELLSRDGDPLGAYRIVVEQVGPRPEGPQNDTARHD